MEQNGLRFEKFIFVPNDPDGCYFGNPLSFIDAVVPALKELDGLGARVAELEAKAEGDLNFIKSLNDEADRYREALSNIEDLVTGEGAIGNVVSRLCAKALRPETYE
jgi:hypothetical protein